MSWSRSALRSSLLALPLAIAALHCNPDAPPRVTVLGDAAADGTADATPIDTAPPSSAPTFAGVKTATASSETQIAVAWDPATDDVSPSSKIYYKVYTAIDPAMPDPATSGAIASSPAGASGLVLNGLTAGTTYNVMVHAVDEAGNEDANTVVKSARTQDVTPPVFGGATTLVGTGANTAVLSWAAATDNGTPAPKIKYRIFITDVPGKEDFSTPTIVSDPGVTSVTLTGLTEAHRYYAVVRAVDTDGNVELNVKEVTGTTLDKTPPLFAGLTTAAAFGTSVTLTWTAARDNVDAPSAIVYDIYQSKAAGGEDFSKPTYTTPPGVSTFNITGLEVSMRYFFVVRARDTSGNQDPNKTERNCLTSSSPDVTPPVFGGLVSATAASATSIDLAWAAATDDYSPPANIVYDIYIGSSAGAEDYTAPLFTSAPGATTYKLSGLKPTTAYYVVVRARDQAGNRDKNIVEKSAITAGDTTPPIFTGLQNALTLSPTSIQLSWSAATDNVSLPGAIRYRIFQATTPGGEAFGAPLATTAGGVTSYVVNSLNPATPYYFVVRALDEAGNSDANTVEKTATTVGDTTPPTFAGVVTFTAEGPASALATWNPASDAVTPPANILYQLYLATTPGGETAIPTATSAPGATSYTFTTLMPGTTYYVIVRARDAAGNVDANTVEKVATTPGDITPPIFGGATSVSGSGPTTLTVNWAAATDNVTPAASIQYFICSTTTPSGCNGGAFVAAANVTGATKYTFPALTPTTTYYFVVRAQDAAGNRDTNNVEVSGITVSDSVPPTFGGLTSATTAGAATVTLGWTAATDNVSTSAQIVYDIFYSTTPGSENFAAPPQATTVPGATTYTIGGLTTNTTYYFVVRARDVAGNRDGNTVEKSAKTTTDGTPPTFAGAASVSALSVTQLRVSWAAATDDTTPQSAIVYDVCWSTLSSACSTSFVAMATTAGGATSYDAGASPPGPTSLTPGTTYYFVVRARDSFGNEDSNSVVRSAATNGDSTPPTWVGGPTAATVLADGVATSGQLNIGWSPATDDGWTGADIRYLICWTTTSTCAGAGFTVMQTTPYGAVTATISGLTSNTLYHVYVRAQDRSLNIEAGDHQAPGTTAVSYTNNIDAQIFAAAPDSGGCNSAVAGCHTPRWDYVSTVGVAWTNTAGCTVSPVAPRTTAMLVDPGYPTNSLIYRKMTGSQGGTCGSQMPAARASFPSGGPFIAALQSMMASWISQGAHNN